MMPRTAKPYIPNQDIDELVSMPDMERSFLTAEQAEAYRMEHTFEEVFDLVTNSKDYFGIHLNCVRRVENVMKRVFLGYANMAGEGLNILYVFNTVMPTDDNLQEILLTDYLAYTYQLAQSQHYTRGITIN